MGTDGKPAPLAFSTERDYRDSRMSFFFAMELPNLLEAFLRGKKSNQITRKVIENLLELRVGMKKADIREREKN